MLNRGIKVFIFLVIITSLYACRDKKKELLEKRKLYTKVATQIAGKKTYDSIYKAANDTIKKAIKNRLSAYFTFIGEDWYLDSLICFNKKMNRCVMALSTTEGKENQDAMNYFYGVKVAEKWYFFPGSGQYILFHNSYKDFIDKSFSTEILHEIAMENIFGGYLKQNKKGIWEVNEKWFEYHFGGAGWDCGYISKQGWIDTCSNKTFENLILEKMHKTWQRKDTTEILTPNLR
ncbi:MAG: hypothetical protein K2Q03_04700 [Sphingobacteriaceae bacterium]|nr:hypothetical protein [Sphingobacteriaceae bacterium]